MGFTDEQLQAIESRNEDLLVSAAAGSGKTTVLVERIIRRILDDEHPVDIDRLLVMTFTKAAAEQMKDKIVKAIEEKRALDPLNRHLIRQSALVHNAKISTIHGFCLDVIRNHFQEIGMDPDFRVADEAECKLLKGDVLAAVLEEAYEKADEGFINMVECLAAGKNDSAIEDILDKLYDFSMSDPEPEAWLKRCEEVYRSPDGNEDWLKHMIGNASLIIDNAYGRALAARELCTLPDGPALYEETAELDIECLKELKDAAAGSIPSVYDRLRELMGQIKWKVLPRGGKNAPEPDPELKDRFKHLRDGYKKDISDLARKEFGLSLDEHRSRIQACTPVVCELTALTRRAAFRYSEAKSKKKIADYNDLEHMCIRILAAGDGNTAREYREYFEEIYVDEYQDSNLVQEELLRHISRGNNLFMVGDVKQSIYSFRLARPQLFTEKYSSPMIRRIDLTYNFRSRESVLKSVNELFSQIMSKELGGIIYDEAASLHPGAYYPGADELQEKTELMLVLSEAGISDRELEAKAVADRIKRLMREQRVYDPAEDDPDRTRPVRYSDIAILLRSAKGWDEIFERVLSEEGIPAHAASQTGYFTAPEISVLLDYLSVLDNPLQDIPMAAVLKSVIGGFSDEELALLRINYPARYLYDSVTSCAGAPGEAAKDSDKRCRDKSAAFLAGYSALRARTAYLPVYELLLGLVDGEYGDCVTAMPDGRRKKANLNMLLKRAEDYGKTSYKGLFHFVRYIEMLKKYEVDYGEAGIRDENDNTVRIMTIHKSKGLEFPVCIMAGMHKKYNLMDSRAAVIPDIDLGLGIDMIDPVRRVKLPTAVKNAVSKKKLYETLAEEERILYVGMTRAREKLIMTGIVNDFDKTLGSDRGVIKSRSFLELVLHGINNAGLPAVAVNTVTAAGLIEAAVRDTVDLETRREELYGIFKGRYNGEKPDAAGVMERRFSFVYPYEDERKQFEKVSVTELKRRSMRDEEAEAGNTEFPGYTSAAGENEPETVPGFIREREPEIPAALHGTAVHRIFEIWDYSRGTGDDDIRSFISYVRSEGLMEDELADCVKIDEVRGFVNSGLAARMKRADEKGLLYREQPFMFSFGGLLIQGIIDAYFIEDDKIVIVDYKTDRVDKPEELADRYHVQLEYYARALSAMTDREVSELLIYSTRHNCTVNIDFSML